MLRERVANNIYVFTSEMYAQVTAGAIVTSAGAVVIDTLPYPAETRQIAQFIEERHGIPVRYVINTHYHADHTNGTCFFRHARVVSHRLCRELLVSRGKVALDKARKSSRDMSDVTLVLPNLIFDDGLLKLHVGGVTLELSHVPGHSPDSIMCLVSEERVLFAADTLMPLPFFADGSYDDYVATLKSLLPESFENVIQGHGEVILRGEVREKIEEDLHYLRIIRTKVEDIINRNKPPEALERIDIEACGKSRIPLNGLVQNLHRKNIQALYSTLKLAQNPS